eukprot:TRINITY_DN78646_c0_g1_i1.p1 TRINITY_DN78646_c0_g1~~TRINITY_DN78646_c0_g1_i1.p1  ORF type:complete len:103 (-),score=5.90 TRINITY_DN78646_c0_g1_i1:36-344(-)
MSEAELEKVEYLGSSIYCLPIFQDLLSNYSRWFPTIQVSRHDFVSGSCNRPRIYAGSNPGQWFSNFSRLSFLSQVWQNSFSLTITTFMFTICLKQSWKKLNT